MDTYIGNIKFSTIEDANVHELASYLQYQTYRTCDYTIGGIYMWRDFFNVRFAKVENTLVLLTNFLDCGECFSYPVGKGDANEALNILRTELGNESLNLCTVPREALKSLQERFGENIFVKEYRDWADYLYNAYDFCTFSGKHFHGQRNHLNKFISMFPDYKFVMLSQDNANLALSYIEKHYGVPLDRLTNLKFNSLLERTDAIHTVEAFEKLKLLSSFTGGVIVANNDVLGVTAGEILGDTLYVHIEKASTNYPGVYQVLSNEYAKFAWELGVKYINREDDTGDLGLRKSKLDYNPIDILQKYGVIIPSDI